MRISKFGALLLIVGCLLILSTYNIFSLDMSRDWPWILVIVGILIIIDSLRGNVRRKSVKHHIHSSERLDILKKLKANEIDIEEAMNKLHK